MPNVYLGINTCFAAKRWPEPERWITLIKHELELDCCQFSFDLVDPALDAAAVAAYADEVRTSTEKHQLLLHSTFTGLADYSWSQLLHPQEALREAAQQWYRRAIDFTARLGARGTGGHVGALSIQDFADAERTRTLVKEMMERLNALAHYAAQKELDFLLFENMVVPREYGHTIEEAQSLLKNVSGGDQSVPLVLCLDVGHPCALHTGTSSDDYTVWLEQPWVRTPVIHLQQTDRTTDHHWPFTAVYNQQGIVRPEPVLRAVRQWSQRDDVYVFLEPIHPFEVDDTIVLNELKESVNYWQAAFKS